MDESYIVKESESLRHSFQASKYSNVLNAKLLMNRGVVPNKAVDMIRLGITRPLQC